MSNTLIPIDTGRSKPYLLEITHHEMAIAGLPPELHGATVVHLSDLHAGFGNTDAVHQEAVRQVNAIKPDLVLFTGDYIDDSVKGDYPIEELLCQFRARLGAYGSFGNHDHRRGILGTRRKLDRAGVRGLLNENLRVEPGLWLAGVDDEHEGKPDLAQALYSTPEEATIVLLAHNPCTFDRISHQNVLVLSGHTHGSQIALPLPTPKMVCLFHLRCRHVAGWYQNGRARMYVNRGLGVTGKPFRYRCPAEISVLRLIPDPRDLFTQRLHEREAQPESLSVSSK